MAGKSDLHDIDVFVRRETERAYGIASPNNERELIWLPKSQCQLERINEPGKPDKLTAPEWLLKERGLI